MIHLFFFLVNSFHFYSCHLCKIAWSQLRRHSAKDAHHHSRSVAIIARRNNLLSSFIVKNLKENEHIICTSIKFAFSWSSFLTLNIFFSWYYMLFMQLIISTLFTKWKIMRVLTFCIIYFHSSRSQCDNAVMMGTIISTSFQIQNVIW